MHYYKRNIGDYHKKAGRLSMLQHGAFTLLMDACYDRERFPTKDEALEWLWASSKEEIEAVDFVLGRFFDEENGVFTQKRIEEEIDNYHRKSETNRRIAIERETKRREKRTNREQDVNESNTLEHEPPPNQEPRTTNQEPKKEHMSFPAESDGPVKKVNQGIPIQEIIDLYNEHLPTMRGCRVSTPLITSRIKSAWKLDKKHQSLAFWNGYFEDINKLPNRLTFWSGENDNKTKHGLDLITRSDIFGRTIDELLDSGVWA